MKIIKTIDEMRAAMAETIQSGLSIGLVPTMGALHDGHVSLIERCASENDISVVSVFVNPIQFGQGEDLDKYPKTLDQDVLKCESVGANYIFCPTVSDMYPPKFSTYVDMSGPSTEVLCGRSRPGHFRGVMTIVSKLFNIIEPNRAYFGQKDAQQLAVIKKMTKDLNMRTEIIGCPTVRETDGLAMSSRNAYLSPSERKTAGSLYLALRAGREALTGSRAFTSDEVLDADSEGVTEAIPGAINAIKHILDAEDLVSVEYVEALDADTLNPVSASTEAVLLAVAAHIGETRLIDNIRVELR